MVAVGCGLEDHRISPTPNRASFSPLNSPLFLTELWGALVGSPCSGRVMEPLDPLLGQAFPIVAMRKKGGDLSWYLKISRAFLCSSQQVEYIWAIFTFLCYRTHHSCDFVIGSNPTKGNIREAGVKRVLPQTKAEQPAKEPASEARPIRPRASSIAPGWLPCGMSSYRSKPPVGIDAQPSEKRRVRVRPNANLNKSGCN